jgi:uncharacterized membrane protein
MKGGSMAFQNKQSKQQEAHRGAWIALGTLAVAGVIGAGYLARRASSEPYHPPDSAPGRTAKRRRFGEYTVVGKTVTIDRPKAELYRFWRDFSNLPQFMENVVSVEETGSDHTRWQIKAPFGTQVTVDTRIVEDREDEAIAWRSVEGSQIETEGKVMFRDAPGDRGTEVEAIIAYKPPAGELGRLVAGLFSREPRVQGRRELKRLKMLMETGEIATARNRNDQD